MDKTYELFIRVHERSGADGWPSMPLREKILFLVSVQTRQNRYRNQVTVDFLAPKDETRLIERLVERIPNTAETQTDCSIDFDEFEAVGRCDAIDGGVVYELKFVSELSSAHFLQCACYVVALDLPCGYLWNTRTNELWLVSVPSRDAFLTAVKRTVLKE